MSLNTIDGLLALHEGRKLKPYVDTVGKVSIGIGRNLTDRGISEDECDRMFNRDIEDHTELLVNRLPWVTSLDNVRFAVMQDMVFNLGRRLFQFKRTLKSIQEGRYDDAAKEMLQSRWSQQVGGRAVRLSKMMRSGEWPDA
jgi:lysozyme